MNKILLILQREYLTRVRKKSFLIMSILGPILIAGVYLVPAWLAATSSDEMIIKVLDESRLFQGQFEDSEDLQFLYTTDGQLDESKQELLEDKGYGALLYIPAIDLDNPEGITIFSPESISAVTENDIRRSIERKIEDMKLERSGLQKEVIDQLQASVSLNTISISEQGEADSSTGASTAAGFVGGFLIYFFIFLYGAQVMQGVIEEKSNRIVEVIISSVKPFQLMMGKIVGVAAVGLTQLLIWIVLGFGVITFAGQYFMPDQQQMAMQQVEGEEARQMESAMPEVLKSINTINFPLLIGGFTFYFLFGYLTYAALFGAVGAAVDNQTETQQFMLPITVPLIIAMVMAGAVITNPNGQIAFWMSIIPLTSPIIMMVRLPFIGFGWELLLSMALLVAGFLFFTWMAAKIYRVGILMYGKKVNFKELGKWLFY